MVSRAPVIIRENKPGMATILFFFHPSWIKDQSSLWSNRFGNAGRTLILAVLLAGLHKRFERVFPGLVHGAPDAEDVPSVSSGHFQ